MDNFHHTKLSHSFRLFKIQPGYHPLSVTLGWRREWKQRSNCSSKVFNEEI